MEIINSVVLECLEKLLKCMIAVLECSEKKLVTCIETLVNAKSAAIINSRKNKKSY